MLARWPSVTDARANMAFTCKKDTDSTEEQTIQRERRHIAALGNLGNIVKLVSTPVRGVTWSKPISHYPSKPSHSHTRPHRPTVTPGHTSPKPPSPPTCHPAKPRGGELFLTKETYETRGGGRQPPHPVALEKAKIWRTSQSFPLLPSKQGVAKSALKRRFARDSLQNRRFGMHELKNQNVNFALCFGYHGSRPIAQGSIHVLVMSISLGTSGKSGESFFTLQCVLTHFGMWFARVSAFGAFLL